nr:Coenzyme F420 hydrogenase/dehydrogenase, beta subunit C-terminal domain [uncultured Anaerosporobacter sp.]
MICDDSLCSGCGACVNACPKSCISFINNEKGDSIPVIDEKICVNCGICRKVCPQLNKIEVKDPIKCFAAYLVNTNKRMDCASGGVANAFYEYALDQITDSVVAGVCMDENMRTHFMLTDDKNDLHKLKGSKYVQADTRNIYQEIGNSLKKQKTVLLIGTPCQVTACKSFLESMHINDDRLITIDLLCHGVSPHTYLDEELNYLIRNKQWEKINTISFRSNRKFRNFHLYIEAKQKDGRLVEYNRYSNEDPYFYAFLKGISLRESCYNCKFACPKRVGDLTIGDFIGLGQKQNPSEFDGDTSNASVILCNTKKGLKYLENAKNKLTLFERPFQEAYEGGVSLQKPFEKSSMRESFISNYKPGDFVQTVEKIAFGDLMKNRLRLVPIRLLKQCIMKMMK